MKLSLAMAFTFFATILCTTSLWATSYNSSFVSADTVLIDLQIELKNSSSYESKQLQDPSQALRVSANATTLDLQLTRTELFNEKSEAIGSTITINIKVPQMAASRDNSRQLNAYPNADLSYKAYSVGHLNNENNLSGSYKNDLYIPFANNQNSNSNLSFSDDFQPQVINNKTPQQNMLSLQSPDLFRDLYNKPQQMMF